MEALRFLWGRLGAQSRAQRGSGWLKVASDRLVGGVRTVILRSFGRLFSKSYYFLKCMKTLGKQWFLKGRRGSKRPSWNHLGHKVVPERDQDSQMTSKSAARGVRAAKVGPVRSDLLSELWKLCGNETTARSKSI